GQDVAGLTSRTDRIERAADRHAGRSQPTFLTQWTCQGEVGARRGTRASSLGGSGFHADGHDFTGLVQTLWNADPVAGPGRVARTVERAIAVARAAGVDLTGSDLPIAHRGDVGAIRGRRTGTLADISVQRIELAALGGR